MQPNKLAVFAISVLSISTLFGCSPQKHPPAVSLVISPTPVPTAKPPFKTVSMSDIPMSTRNGEIFIDFYKRTDSDVSSMAVLATVLWSDRKSPVFEIKTTTVVMSSQIHSTMRYNRRKKMLTTYDWTSIAGMGITSEFRSLCRNVTDTAIFKTVALGTIGNLKSAGCDCKTTDLLKAKKRSK